MLQIQDSDTSFLHLLNIWYARLQGSSLTLSHIITQYYQKQVLVVLVVEMLLQHCIYDRSSTYLTTYI